MKLRDIERQAIALPERDRADLACRLLETLRAPDTEVSDKEVLERERELQDGSVKALTHKEFVRRVRKERQR